VFTNSRTVCHTTCIYNREDVTRTRWHPTPCCTNVRTCFTMYTSMNNGGSCVMRFVQFNVTMPPYTCMDYNNKLVIIQRTYPSWCRSMHDVVRYLLNWYSRCNLTDRRVIVLVHFRTTDFMKDRHLLLLAGHVVHIDKLIYLIYIWIYVKVTYMTTTVFWHMFIWSHHEGRRNGKFSCKVRLCFLTSLAVGDRVIQCETRHVTLWKTKRILHLYRCGIWKFHPRVRISGQGRGLFFSHN
jgi:hypothetical protein